MTELFDAVSSRLKAIFTAHAALELEAEVIARHVERKAALLKQATKLEEEGLKDLAAELRQHAGGLDPRRPAEAVLPMLTQNTTTPRPSCGPIPAVNGVAPPASNPATNGTPAVPALNAANETAPVVNGVVNPSNPEPDLPTAIPIESTPEIGTSRGASTSRKKSR